MQKVLRQRAQPAPSDASRTTTKRRLRQEKLLIGAYDSQSQRVGSEASKTAQYNSLKREVDTQHQMYQTLLVQQSQANLSSSVPINPIRIVEQSQPRPKSPISPSRS